ncbi:MAG: phage DNA encapsidation protein [Bacteroidaceae bacterium]|nr:phage DNA encapsidation protein [Bacteroidaceae bacterium]
MYESLKAYFKNGETAAIIRRWDTDFSGATSMRTCYDSLRLNGHQENVIKKLSHGQYEAVEYRAGNYCLVSFDDEGNAIFHADKMVARGYALNLSGKVKGSAQPTCTRILYDEFLDENGRYLKDELGALRSIVNTIVRKRTNWKVYLMGNTIDMYAPIFQDLRIADKIQGLKPGDTKIFTKKSGLKISLSLVNVNDRITVPNANDYMFDFDDEVSDM